MVYMKQQNLSQAVTQLVMITTMLRDTYCPVISKHSYLPKDSEVTADSNTVNRFEPSDGILIPQHEVVYEISAGEFNSICNVGLWFEFKRQSVMIQFFLNQNVQLLCFKQQ